MLANYAPFIECASEINRSCKRSGFCDMIPIYNLIKKVIIISAYGNIIEMNQL